MEKINKDAAYLLKNFTEVVGLNIIIMRLFYSYEPVSCLSFGCVTFELNVTYMIYPSLW